MAAPDIFDKKLLTANIKWKGRTYTQLISTIQKNTPIYSNKISPKLLLRALPLQIYRREIASKNTKCNPRTSMIGQFENPGQAITTAVSTLKGMATILDFNYINNTCQHPKPTGDTASKCAVFLSPDMNAKRRVRSAGMIRNKFNTNSNNDRYYTDTNQYLTARNRTFKQTQYFHIRQGDSTAVPGTAGSYQNIYSANGITHCPKFELKKQVIFQYGWLDNLDTPNESGPPGDLTMTTYQVIIPQGSYDLVDFNNILQKTMYKNTHYLVKKINGNYDSIMYPLQFIFNGQENKIQINAYVFPQISDSWVQDTYYFMPDGASWSLLLGYYLTPYVVIPNDAFFYSGMNLNPQTFPPLNYIVYNKYDDQINVPFYYYTQTILGGISPAIQPNYVPLYYKPKNPQFASQGAVSASSLIARKKYNTITTSANTFRTAYGNQTADAVAYGVPSYGYTLKDRVGYKDIKIPTVNKYNGKMNTCSMNRRMRNMRFG